MLRLTALLVLFATTAVAAPTSVVDYDKGLDRSCKSDDDCAVKDVKSCCGAMPSCVNKAAQPDAELVKKLCAKDGTAGVCGFVEIKSCTCMKGRCEAKG